MTNALLESAEEGEWSFNLFQDQSLWKLRGQLKSPVIQVQEICPSTNLSIVEQQIYVCRKL